jgi:hypothetical protein
MLSDDNFVKVYNRMIANLEYCSALERKIDKICGALITLSLISSEEDSDDWQKQFDKEMAELCLPASLTSSTLNFIDEGMRAEYEKKLRSIGSSVLYLALRGYDKIDLSIVNLNKE